MSQAFCVKKSLRLKGVNLDLDHCHFSNKLRNWDIAQSWTPNSMLSSYSVLPPHHFPSQNKDLKVIFQKPMQLSECTNLKAYQMHLERFIGHFFSFQMFLERIIKHLNTKSPSCPIFQARCWYSHPESPNDEKTCKLYQKIREPKKAASHGENVDKLLNLI